MSCATALLISPALLEAFVEHARSPFPASQPTLRRLVALLMQASFQDTVREHSALFPRTTIVNAVVEGALGLFATAQAARPYVAALVSQTALQLRKSKGGAVLSGPARVMALTEDQFGLCVTVLRAIRKDPALYDRER